MTKILVALALISPVLAFCVATDEDGMTDEAWCKQYSGELTGFADWTMNDERSAKWSRICVDEYGNNKYVRPAWK